jgi:hypothetical protein
MMFARVLALFALFVSTASAFAPAATSAGMHNSNGVSLGRPSHAYSGHTGCNVVFDR